jgi:hypothetical protein
MLVSVVYEVESEKNLRCELSWQQPIYSDDIHRLFRYIAGTAKPAVMDVFPRRRDREIRRRRDAATCSRLFGRDAQQVVAMVCRTLSWDWPGYSRKALFYVGVFVGRKAATDLAHSRTIDPSEGVDPFGRVTQA